MRTLLTLTLALFSLVGAWSSGCARQSKWKNTLPEDFHIKYQYSEDMYEYSIEGFEKDRRELRLPETLPHLPAPLALSSKLQMTN